MRQAMWGIAFMIGSAAASGATPDGATLYAQHCAACHGTQGRGGVGVPIALPAFLNSVPDEYLRETIRRGRPGRVMPAFAQLSEAELDALVAHLRARSTAPAPHFSTAAVQGDARRGQRLYAKHCATCHGANGEGGRGTGVTLSRPRDLPILAPALNNPGFLAAASDAMIEATLANGRAGTPMPSFLKLGLSRQDIRDLTAHIRSYEHSVPPAGTTIPTAQSAIIVRESPYTLEQTVKNLQDALKNENFRLIRTQNFDQGLVKEEAEDSKRVIVYMCNFYFLNDALKVDPRVGLFLPCRFTVAEHDGKVRVMTINPKWLSTVFNNTELNRLCDEMSKIYINIIEIATL